MTTCAFHSIKLKKVKKGEIVVVLLFQGIKGHITRIKVYLVEERKLFLQEEAPGRVAK
jgi:ribosomal protein S28E/S33